jgi:hypothetical protein
VKQKVIIGKPPVYSACVTKFGKEVIEGKPILFSWGDCIFNPENIIIPRELYAHESVHGSRQTTTDAFIWEWWGSYLSSEQFRFNEELLAHREEWRNYVRLHPGKNCEHVLEAIAGRLASELYGSIVTLDDARQAILAK